MLKLHKVYGEKKKSDSNKYDLQNISDDINIEEVRKIRWDGLEVMN